MRKTLAPDAGELFDYLGGKYRVSGWLKQADRVEPKGWWARFVADFRNDPLAVREVRFCPRHEATHVYGEGLGSCIAFIEDIQIEGVVGWAEELLIDARDFARRLGESREMPLA